MSTHRDERRDRIRARLQDALAEHPCLAVALRTSDELVLGYCVGVGRRWALLRAAEPWPDGLVAVRLTEIERISRPTDAPLQDRAFEAEGAWPPQTVDDVDLDRTEGLIDSLAHRYPLLGITLREDGDSRFVGTPALVAEGTLMFQELTVRGEWDALSTWRLRDLAQVSVDDRYLRLLARLAPERPQQPSPFTD